MILERKDRKGYSNVSKIGEMRAETFYCFLRENTEVVTILNEPFLSKREEHAIEIELIFFNYNVKRSRATSNEQSLAKLI